MSDKNHDWIVARFVDLNEQIKAETGIDLLQKSPQALAMLCIADVLSDVGMNIKSAADTVSYSDFSRHDGG
ncbi:hypothetical protein [Nitrosomonas sp.]|uniref:hypothetical protein n=1 Tax=Nitrosomonas sp. TaxID=42353 RepID=UPI00208D2CB8|nr:hypothetical protein [Nitrosomonas sp.]GJL73965.1 MAG: hypothetical protein NMNS02_00710 [Nitrosomonas sp.]